MTPFMTTKKFHCESTDEGIVVHYLQMSYSLAMRLFFVRFYSICGRLLRIWLARLHFALYWGISIKAGIVICFTICYTREKGEGGDNDIVRKIVEGLWEGIHFREKRMESSYPLWFCSFFDRLRCVLFTRHQKFPRKALPFPSLFYHYTFGKDLCQNVEYFPPQHIRKTLSCDEIIRSNESLVIQCWLMGGDKRRSHNDEEEMKGRKDVGVGSRRTCVSLTCWSISCENLFNLIPLVVLHMLLYLLMYGKGGVRVQWIAWIFHRLISLFPWFPSFRWTLH